MGYTLRTASLMTTPEYSFQDANPSEYTLFGIRYLLVPPDRAVPAGAQLVMSSAQYDLWVLPANGYFDVVDTTGTVRADRGHLTDVDPTGLTGRYSDLTVAWAGAAAAAPTDPSGVPLKTAPGSVLSQQPDLVRGRASAVVHLQRRAVVLLSASYDPGWQVTVDGRRARTEMLAPAVVGVTVGPGSHRVAFSYHGYPHYTLLVVAGAARSRRGDRRVLPGHRPAPEDGPGTGDRARPTSRRDRKSRTPPPSADETGAPGARAQGLVKRSPSVARRSPTCSGVSRRAAGATPSTKARWTS